MQRGKNIKEHILQLLGPDPTEEKINEVQQQTKVSPLLIKQWISFQTKYKQQSGDQESQYRKDIDFFCRKGFKEKEPSEEKELKIKKSQCLETKQLLKEAKQAKRLLMQTETENKKQRKVDKLQISQANQQHQRSATNEISKADIPQDSLENSNQFQPIDLPAYYMIKLQLNLMEQAIGIHKKILKIIESKFDFFSLL